MTITGVQLTVATQLLVGVVLIIAARGILRQRRAAAWLVLPWFVVSMGSALAHLGSSARALGPAVVIVLIARGRPALVGVTDAKRRRLAGRAALAAGTLDASVGVIGLIVNRSHYLPVLTAGQALREAAVRLGGGRGHVLAQDAVARALFHSLPLLGEGAVLAIVTLILAPLSDDADVDRHARDHAARLASDPGGDTVTPFAMRADKRYVFSPDGRAGVAYRVVCGVAVAGGDPIGAPEASRAAFDEYRRRCAARGWIPFVIGASDATTAMARARGFHTLHYGDEALVDVDTFRLDQPSMRNVRQGGEPEHQLRHHIRREPGVGTRPRGERRVGRTCRAVA